MAEPTRSPRRRAAAAALLALVVVAVPFAGATVAADEPVPTPTIDLSHDIAPGRSAEVPADQLPAGLVTTEMRQAASVDPIQPGMGFTPIASVPNFGAYRFQLVDGTPEVVRGWVQSVANQLTTLTNIGFTVDAGFVPRPANYAQDLFATDPSDSSTWGIIRVLMFDNQSPCGSLAPPLIGGWKVGCGGPDDLKSNGQTVAFVRGNVWLSTGLLGFSELAAETTAHESGHAIGLAHYNPNYEGFKQLMHESVSGPAVEGLCGTRYRSGDRNGVWYMHNAFAWLVTAQYRDFLGRIPDRAGYDFWLRSGVDAGALASNLSNSDEWVGHVVDELYVGFRGGPADPAGRAYWSGLLRQLGVPAVAALMYASDEYFNNHGGNIDSWIAALYHDLLGAGRVPSSADLDYWRGITLQRGRSTTAHAIYQSIENRRSRVDRLYTQLLDRGADDAGREFWAEQILRYGDLSLATFLAASPEYQDHADEFALSGTTCG